MKKLRYIILGVACMAISCSSAEEVAKGTTLGLAGSGIRPLAPVVEKTVTAKDYIQDGLVAMWDGIENAGWGVHDANATTWVDLAGGIGDATLAAGSYWSDNGLNKDYTSHTDSMASHVGRLTGSTITIECVFAIANVSPVTNLKFGRYWVFQVYKNRLAVSYNNDSTLTSTPPILTNGVAFGAAFTRRSSVTNVYLNGGLVSPDPDGTFYILSGFNDTFHIGYGSSERKCFAMRFYTRALTAAEVAHNYAIDKRRFNLP